MNLEKRLGTIGYPSALHFYEFYPFFKTFFKEIGWNVKPSQETNEKIVELGEELAPSQTCLAQKIAYAHTSLLIDDPGIDKVFIPAFISGEEYDAKCNTHMCVYVQANKDLQLAVFGDKLEKKAVMPVLEFRRKKRWITYEQLLEVANELNPYLSQQDVSKAIDKSFAALNGFRAGLKKIGMEAIQKAVSRKEPLFVLLSRYYVARDPRLNSSIDKIVQEKGFDCISMDMLPFESLVEGGEFKKLHPDVYWSYHMKMLAAAHYVREHPFLKPICITCFPCGPDSFIKDELKYILGGNMLVIKVDSADSSANTRTRVESFINTIINSNQYQKVMGNKKKLENPLVLYNPLTEDKERILLLNLMCDHGHVFGAALRSRGVPAFCFEPNNEETLLTGKKYTDDGACIPCAETGGHFYRSIITGKVRLDRPDIVFDSCFAKENPGLFYRTKTKKGIDIVETDFDPKRFAFFQGTTDGPCRYGRYINEQAGKTIEIYRKELTKSMAEKGKRIEEILSSPEYNENPFRFFTLNSDNSYSLEGLGFMERIKLQKDFWKAVRTMDILQKAVRIQRVKERVLGDTDEIYERTLRQLCSRIERKMDYTDVLYKTAKGLMSIPIKEVEPIFDQVVGEVYVRLNEHINNNVVRALEAAGIGAVVAPFGSWVKYVSARYLKDLEAMRKNAGLLEKFSMFFDSYLIRKKLHYQQGSEEKIELPFLPITGIFPESHIDEIVSEGKKYLDFAFTGEAIISAAELSLAMQHGFSGALNLMPFTCMPSNVVAGLESKIRGNNQSFPINHFEYDGSPDMSYEDKLAAHIYQVQKYFEKHANEIKALQQRHLQQALKVYSEKADKQMRVDLG